MTAGPVPDMAVEYCGEWFEVDPETPFHIGREADLSIDDNPFLHRRLLSVSAVDGLWMLANIGSRLSVTVTDGSGRLQSWLGPGARLPLVFRTTTVVFTAGATTYEFAVHAADAPYVESGLGVVPSLDDLEAAGDTTLGTVALTPSQLLLILSLAEPLLLRDGTGTAEIPASAVAAARLGWSTTRFNRKLDNVCDKLSKIGVQGLRGGVTSLATNRRARLVEYAIATRMVTRNELPLLDQPQEA